MFIWLTVLNKISLDVTKLCICFCRDLAFGSLNLFISTKINISFFHYYVSVEVHIWIKQQYRGGVRKCNLVELEGDNFCNLTKNKLHHVGFIDMFSKCHKILVTCDAAIRSFYHKYWFYPKMLVWKNLSYCKIFLNLNFLNKQRKSLKNTRKGILFSSKTYRKHKSTKYNSTTTSNVRASSI